MAKVTGPSITIQFSVSEVSKLTSVRSPQVLLHGIPWEVGLKKYKNGAHESLAVFLFCTNEDNTSNWTAAACATIKLLPFSDDQRVIEHHIIPNVYHRLASSFGIYSLIPWNDLINEDKKYVKDDTIRLEAKIEAEDPTSLSRSIPKFQCIDKSCECGCHATFELTVMNVSNLMAVRSPEFTVRGMPWNIIVFKKFSTLDVCLDLVKNFGKVSCQVTMSVKLKSSKEDVDPIEKSNAKNVQWSGSMYIYSLVLWEEMLKPQNGFVNENSITLKIEIKSDKPVGNVPAANPKGATQSNPFECSICLEGLGTKEMSTTPCGHSFCTACIKQAIQNRRACPLCNKMVQLDDLRPLFLSA